MVREKKNKKCYVKDSETGVLLPHDKDHNCELFQYDEEEYSYVSNLLMRKIVNVAAIAGTVLVGVKFVNSPVFHETRDIFLYGGVASLAYVMMTNNLPMKFVDGLYAATGYDLVWGITDDINDTIYVATYIPRMLWNYFTFSSTKKDAEVNTDPDKKGDLVKNQIADTKDLSKDVGFADDSRLAAIQEKISDSDKEMFNDLKTSVAEMCVSCEVGDMINGEFFEGEE